MLLYLEDDTLQVTEPPETNSGLPQVALALAGGKYCKRCYSVGLWGVCHGQLHSVLCLPCSQCGLSLSVS